MFLEVIDISKILYFIALLTLTSGLFMILTCDNYVRKIIGLSVMQSSVLIFYLILGKVGGGTVPIDRAAIIQTSHYTSTEANKAFLENTEKRQQASVNSYKYSSPLPQVLMLTAIVVGFATLSLGLSLIYRISKQFGTISESAINFSEK